MIKRKLFLFIAAGLFLTMALVSLPFQVGSVQGNWQEQTWASRTPTPQGGPPDPTNTSQPPPPTTDPGGGGGGQNTPVPPSPTSDAGSTSTPDPATTVVIITPPGGYVATAQPCGLPPTVQALGQVNIRSGPGLDYDATGTLIYLESRPIIGRAEFATWWLIQLPDNVTGWVANQAVSVQGYTGAVPVVEPPDINNASPTPGPLWQPTPNPICTPPPTPTATNTVEVEAAQPTPRPISNTPTEAPPEPTATAEPEQPTETATIAPTDTAVPAPTTNTAAPITDEAATDNSDDPGTTSSSWILFVGIGLLVVGGVSVVLRRR